MVSGQLNIILRWGLLVVGVRGVWFLFTALGGNLDGCGGRPASCHDGRCASINNDVTLSMEEFSCG